jgi:hypothetical protein
MGRVCDPSRDRLRIRFQMSGTRISRGGGGGEPPKTEVVAERRGGADRRDGGGAVASSVGGLMPTIATAPPIEVRV